MTDAPTSISTHEVETALTPVAAEESGEPIMCPLHPHHDPFPSETSYRMHVTRVHKDIPDATDPQAHAVPAGALVDARGNRVPLDPSELSTIDMVGTRENPIDDSPRAILDRQKANGGLFDPLTLKRVVVLEGKVRIRQTVGYDAKRGQEERRDYFDYTFGWVREGLINERGRVHMTEDGPLVL